MTRFFDTSALLNGAHEILKASNPFLLSITTLRELEDIKASGKKDEEVKYKARQALVYLYTNPASYVVVDDTLSAQALSAKNLPLTNDNHIMMDAVLYETSNSTRVMFYTSDLSCHLLALNQFKLASKLFTPNIASANYDGYLRVSVSDDELAEFYMEEPGQESPKTQNKYGLLRNQYLVLENSHGTVIDMYRWNGTEHIPLKYDTLRTPHMGIIMPANVEQKLAFDLLQNDDITIKILAGRYGSGKAQPNNTPIPTPRGWTTMGALSIGDYVFDLKGKPTKILGVFPQGRLDNYKITLSDGRTTYCNDQHLWSCVTSKGNLKTHTVQEMVEKGLRTNDGSLRYVLPSVGGVDYPEQVLSIHPYVMGVFLGDGCCLERNLTVSSKDEFIVEKTTALIGSPKARKLHDGNFSWNFHLPEDDDPDMGRMFNTKQFFKEYKEIIDYCYNKRIPKIYMHGSINQRWQLLQGLMDTDGSVEISKARVSFSTTSRGLADDMVELALSLGFSRATIYIDQRTEKYTLGCAYTVHLSGPKELKLNAFSLPRKLDYIYNSIKGRKRNWVGKVSIVNIEKMPEQEEMTCILVDNPEHIYLTESFIPTHNTLLMLSHALHLLRTEKINKIIYMRNGVKVKNVADIGMLPGDSQAKLLPGAMPLVDHLGSLDVFYDLVDSEKIELIDLGMVRGRSWSNAVILCGEAENLTKQHIQLLIGRVGKDSQLWIDGDFKQVDSKIFESNNGMMTAIDRLKGRELFGYVKLQKTERSDTASLADLLD